MENRENYVQAVIRELNALLPGLENELVNLYALLVLTRGAETTLKDVHDAWGVWRNLTNPTHKSLVPFDQLSLEVQELDRKYMEAIHKAAASS